MKHNYLIVFLLIFISFSAHAQLPGSDTTSTNKPVPTDTTTSGKPEGPDALLEGSFLTTVIPPSPTSQAFDKYINYDVSIHNGIPNITIPLYEIKEGAISIPVTLNYHASGIKYRQSDGEVGVGWVLQPGYRISRTIYGRPDELTEKPVIPNLNSFADNKTRDSYLSRFIKRDENDIPFGGTEFDGEYDMFTYSTPAGSGTFVIDDRINKTIKQISKSNFSFEYTSSPTYSIDKFKIKDGNGITYTTGAVENNLNSGYAPIPASAWVVEDITDALGNNVKMNYVTVREINSYTPATLTARSGSSDGVCITSSTSLVSNPPTPYNVQRINEITTEQLTVRFYRDAADVLDSITVKDKNNARIRKISFHQSFNGIHNFLDSILIYGNNQVNPQVYKFNYHQKSTNQNLNNFIPDYWGFYKIQAQSSTHAFPNFQYFALCNSSYGSDDLQYSGLTRTDRNALNGNDAARFTLAKITYPTFGTTEYSYEPNKYFGLRDDNNQVGLKYVGIRVSSISSTDPFTNSTLIKDYRYGTDEAGTGRIASVDFADSQYFAQERPIYACANTIVGNGVYLAQEVSFNTHPNAELSAAFMNNSPVLYGKVTEYTRAIGNSVWTNGKVEFLFNSTADAEWAAFITNPVYAGYRGISLNTGYCVTSAGTTGNILYHNYYIYKSKVWDKPVLHSKTTFKSVGTGYEPILKETNFYNVTGTASLFGLKVRRFYANPNDNYSSATNYYSSDLNSLFDYNTYEVSIANKVLTESITTTYNQSDSLQQRTKYYYNSDYQISKTETWNSDGSLFTNTIKFPVDFGTITGTDNTSLGVKKLQTAHTLNIPIENVMEHNTDANRMVSATFKVFKTDRPLLDNILIAESAAPVTNFVHASTVSGAVNYDARYQSRARFNAYDAKGNLLEQQIPNGVKESYLWGYSSKYPVAKVTGSDLATVQGFINQTTLDNTSTSDVAMRTELDKIRSGLAATKAQVFTYTYKPLIGVSSETNPANRTITYEYDNFGRLSASKNSTGLTRASYCYNYAGQPTPCDALAPTGSIAATTLALIPDIAYDPPLPVTLLDFKAVKSERSSLLTWSTTSESNSDHFQIERSRDAKAWTKIGTIQAAGESSEQQNYLYTDHIYLSGITPNGEFLYRLKMIDKDGSFTYSLIKSVVFDEGENSVLYPNPITIGEQLNLITEDLSKISDIHIFDTLGKQVLHSPASKRINTIKLSAGVYVVQITFSDGSITTHRIVKQ